MATGIDLEYSHRLRSLLSVDDIVVAMRDLFLKYDEWENTYFIYTSGTVIRWERERMGQYAEMVTMHGWHVPTNRLMFGSAQ